MHRNIRSSIGGNRCGFTLIEMMIAIAVVATVVIGLLYVIMRAHSTNTVLSAAMTANAAIRAQAEEAFGVATRNATLNAGASELGGSYARAFVAYYGSLVTADGSATLPIGPDSHEPKRAELDDDGDILTYRFVVPEPGDFNRKDETKPIYYNRGIGEMHIYLKESTIPNIQGIFATETPISNATAWETMSDANTDRGELSTDSIDSADLKKPPETLERVFADIVVTYYADPERTRQIFVNGRRILVTGTVKQGKLTALFR